MSVTVEDLMRLPSLRQARVVGGRRGLSKIVSSISVLESTDPQVLVDEVFPRGEYSGGELVITGFLNMLEDVDLQYANMLRLIEGGEVGLILFYVGVYLPGIDPRLIQLAEERDFVLICMPEGVPTLRYGEVICDVMEYIYQDRARSDSIVSEILERVSTLPDHQQTLGTVLHMLSDRLSCSVVLFDSAGHMLNLVAWPRSLEATIREGLELLGSLPPEQSDPAFPFLPDALLHTFPIPLYQGQDLQLLLIKEGQQLTDPLLEQAADVVRLGANIWGRQHGEVAIQELIRAILQDEPMKMRRLADIFHINVADIHEMWILRCENCPKSQFRKLVRQPVQEELQPYCRTVVADLYENSLIVFMEWMEKAPEGSQLARSIREEFRKQGIDLTLTRCYPLATTADVRQAYLTHQEYIRTVRQIWPSLDCCTLQELQFAAHCQQLLQKGEAAFAAALAPLTPLRGEREEAELLHTLTVYLLDAKSSTSRCSELLFLHKNTIKYRLKRLRELLGCHVDKSPEQFFLYQAVALQRLLSGPEPLP